MTVLSTPIFLVDLIIKYAQGGTVEVIRPHLQLPRECELDIGIAHLESILRVWEIISFASA